VVPTLSFVARVHESQLACIKAESIVNLVAVCIFSSKSKEPSKLLIGDLIPPSLDHLMKLFCVPPLLNIQGGKELSYDFIVLIFSESHDIPQVLGSTNSHHLIKDPITFALHVVPVNLLENCHGLVLGNDNGLIEVLLKYCMKPIINASFLLNKPWVFFPFFPSPSLFCSCS
jgi:hypothetical protein